MNRRQFLVAATCVPALGTLAGPVRAGPDRIGADERVLGDAGAAITVIEYASLTCPYCARFHIEVLPLIKRNWIDTGRARLVYRHFPLDGLALRAALVADAMETDRRFFDFVATLFETQAEWTRADDPLEAIAAKARVVAGSSVRVAAALHDEKAMDAVLAQVVEARDGFGVKATPTFIVDGRVLVGLPTYEELERVLEAALSAR